MRITTILLSLAIAGSAFAQQSDVKSDAKAPAAVPTAAKPAVMTKSVMMKKAGRKASPLAISHPAGEKAMPASVTMPPEPKITKEEAGTTALGALKNAELVGSELKTVKGKQVWAVTLKEEKHNRTVLVDANDGTIVKPMAKHTMHAMHKSKKADDQAPKN